MKRQTYYFKVGHEEHKVIAESRGQAMQWMNRQVIDKLGLHPMTWMDDKSRPNSYFMYQGDFFS